MLLVVTLGAVVMLAFSNGSNDNGKGVATLYGSGATSYRTALLWASLTTMLGSLFALVAGGRLLATFSGKGIVPDAISSDRGFMAAVVTAAAVTVLLASRIGAPISTTHALLGGLVGAGLARAPESLAWGRLSSLALVPLVMSPLLAAVLTAPLYLALRFIRHRTGLHKESCACIDATWVPLRLAPAGAGATTGASMPLPRVATCRDRYVGHIAGIDAQSVLDILHFVSCGAMSFARGLNDTPKIAAALLAAHVLQPASGVALTAAAMATGGLLFARRVAETMSRGISAMNDGQGFTASLVTASLVMAASFAGFPVSTTHVAVGSLVGMGAVTRQAHRRKAVEVMLAWIVTLPVSAILAALAASLLEA